MIINIKIIFTNQLNHSRQRESYMKELHRRYVVSSRRTSRYLILVIKRKEENVVHYVVFLHITAIAEKVHLVYLLLILRLQLLLSYEPSLQLFFLGNEPCL